MKIFGITLLIMVLLTGFSLAFDLLQGFDTMTSVRNNLSPFQVMETPELFVFAFFIFVFFFDIVMYFFQNKKRNKERASKNP